MNCILSSVCVGVLIKTKRFSSSVLERYFVHKL